jgi:2-polyprenyl-6-hydroxyphenyl methylase/3-demethylubiquinone-9 3-methyltransferase
MQVALKNVIPLVKSKGLLYIAIYNKFDGFPISSSMWKKIKRVYSNKGRFWRKIIEVFYVSYYFLGLIIYGKNPKKYVKEYASESRRGMDFFTDAKDWLGGYPYEYATVNEIKTFYEHHGFELLNITETSREGCNEFLFKKIHDKSVEVI